MKKLILLILLLFGCMVCCLSYEKLNFNYGFISDNAKIITSEHYSRINNIILELQNTTKADIAVVTVNSLQGNKIGDVAVQIGRDYKVGSKQKNNGVVFLIAPNEREARIEVGYGLENIITNSIANDIMNNTIIPEFKNNNYSLGIYNGVIELANLIAKSENIVLESTKGVTVENTKKSEDIPWWLWPILIIGAIFGRGKKGHFGGGGGFSGGRGSTGRW